MDQSQHGDKPGAVCRAVYHDVCLIAGAGAYGCRASSAAFRVSIPVHPQLFTLCGSRTGLLFFIQTILTICNHLAWRCNSAGLIWTRIFTCGIPYIMTGAPCAV